MAFKSIPMIFDAPEILTPLAATRPTALPIQKLQQTSPFFRFCNIDNSTQTCKYSTTKNTNFVKWGSRICFGHTANMGNSIFAESGGSKEMVDGLSLSDNVELHKAIQDPGLTEIKNSCQVRIAVSPLKFPFLHKPPKIQERLPIVHISSSVSYIEQYQL